MMTELAGKHLKGINQLLLLDSLRMLISLTKADTAKLILYENLGDAYYLEKKMDSAVLSFQHALEINKKNDYSLQRQCWNTAAIDYRLYEMSNYLESLKYAFQHLALSEKINDTLQKGMSHLVFGHNFREMGYYRQALNHYFTAKEYCKIYWISRNKPEDNTYTIQCIAQTYLKMNVLDSALIYARQAHGLAVRDSVGGCILLSDRIFGDIYLAKGEDETALRYYRQYLPDFVKYKETNRDLGFVLNSMARIFQKRGQIDSAIFYAKKALQNAGEYEDQENILNAAALLAEYYEDKDDHAAFNYLKIAVKAKDSMLSTDKLKQAQILSFNEQVREKEKKEAEAKEIAKIRTIITIAAIVISIISFLIWSRIRQLRLKHKMVLEQREAEKLKAKYEKELLTLEAKALRAQMNPHFIYNCMNSIKALIQNDDRLRSIEYLTTFSKLIRTVFHNSDKRQISLFDEIETCRLYAQLESMRLNGKLKYDFCIDPNLDLKSVMVPALIVQPFIENAIWHGIVPKDGGIINISVKGNEEAIICEVDDDGIGREMSRLNKPITPITHESKGVHLSQQRLNLEKMLNDTSTSIEIIDKYENNIATGTKIKLSFNLN